MINKTLRFILGLDAARARPPLDFRHRHAVKSSIFRCLWPWQLLSGSTPGT